MLQEIVDPPLGAIDSHQYNSIKINVDPGDMLVLMTDGLLEFPTAAKSIWSTKRLLSFLDKAASTRRAPLHLVHSLQEKMGDLQNHKGDDVTFLAIQRDVA
jgi:serine phosphatase RsbU (regulator of sigma subunit)